MEVSIFIFYIYFGKGFYDFVCLIFKPFLIHSYFFLHHYISNDFFSRERDLKMDWSCNVLLIQV